MDQATLRYYTHLLSDGKDHCLRFGQEHFFDVRITV